ncbi:MAG TPA: T9SS type A sorting domain-containing protein [Bacteroidia bacterium]|nr:T9SS type A sorting domain-containing protein [Bacteroidia bacterium]
MNKGLTLLLFLGFLFLTMQVHAQCSGAIGVSGAGCGCLAGCNLTSFGGPNCGGGVAGNCSAGQVAMGVNIAVPAGCTYTVNGTMANRSGCSASGADAGEQMKVDILGGVKPFQTGASNSTLTDSYVLTGPGTIRVSGTANRADEIITYTISGSAGCPSCNPLPVELIYFSAVAEENYVKVSWETGTEINCDYFTIERAGADGIFLPVGTMTGAGNSSQLVYYTNYDANPLKGVSYYRLKQTDFNGDYKYYPPQPVYFDGEYRVNTLNTWNCESGLCFYVYGWEGPVQVTVFDAAGRQIASQTVLEDGTGTIPLDGNATGIYMVHFVGTLHREIRKVNR